VTDALPLDQAASSVAARLKVSSPSRRAAPWSPPSLPQRGGSTLGRFDASCRYGRQAQAQRSL